jgi:hypothetical protein
MFLFEDSRCIGQFYTLKVQDDKIFTTLKLREGFHSYKLLIIKDQKVGRLNTKAAVEFSAIASDIDDCLQLYCLHLCGDITWVNLVGCIQ